MFSGKRLLWACAGVALMLAACSNAGSPDGGDAPASGGGGPLVRVSASEFEFELNRTEVPAGEPITFQVTNDGAIEHDFVIEPPGAENEPLSPEAQTGEIQRGDTVEITVTFDEPGTYQIGCHIPGHYEAGMFTEITVSG